MSAPGRTDAGLERGIQGGRWKRSQGVELRELWRRYKDDGDDSARERLVVAYSPLVKFVAGRHGVRASLARRAGRPDLLRHDRPDRGDGPLRARAPHPLRDLRHARIHGAIIDELRSLDWVPRSVRARAREIEEANSKLEHELGRAPTDDELAERLKIDGGAPGSAAPDRQLLDPRPGGAVDVADASGGGSRLSSTRSRTRALDPQAALDSSEVKDRLQDAIQDLPERETLVIALYYFENLTLREIGEVLGVTESRISQLHSKAVLRLRSQPPPSRSP